jgi:endoglucanase
VSSKPLSKPTRLRFFGLFAFFLFALAGLVFATQASAGVAVRGALLMRNEKPWVPHGVVQIAFVAPPAAQKSVFQDAYQHYSPADYEEMRRHGIDSVRMQVSQPGLDPQNRLFDAAFREKVIEAVRAARAAGLVVLVSVQDEGQSGETSVASLPNDGTARVWRSIAPVFATDGGVMYEILNEPNLPANPQNWRLWAAAMNRMIAVVRREGAPNVVVADGLMFAERLSGAPDLQDAAGQVVYASHPYAHDANGQTKAAWDEKLGAFARSHPVIVTEWTTGATFFCNDDTPSYADRFLHFLDARGIGLMVYGWDFSGPKFGSAFHGFPPQATSFEDRRCGDPGFGPGALIERFYSGRESRSRAAVERP